MKRIKLKKIIVSIQFISALYLISTSAFSKDLQKKFQFFDDLQTKQTFFTNNSNLNKTSKSSTQIKFLKSQVFAPHLKFLLDFSLILEVGSSSSLYTDQFTPYSTLRLNNSYMQSSYNTWNFKLGTLNQGFIKNPLLLDDIPFLAAREEIFICKIIHNSCKINISVFLEQAIASNQDLSFRLGGRANEITKMFLYGANLNFKNSFLKMELIPTIFQFNNVSSSIADKARYLGGSVSGTNAISSKFLYQHSGVSLFLKVIKKFSLFDIILKSNFLYNKNAPNNRNYASLISIATRYKNQTINFLAYKNQSDSNISPFASLLFPANTKGFKLDFEAKYNKYIFDISFVQNTLINTNIFQDHAHIITSNFKFNFQ